MLSKRLHCFGPRIVEAIIGDEGDMNKITETICNPFFVGDAAPLVASCHRQQRTTRHVQSQLGSYVREHSG